MHLVHPIMIMEYLACGDLLGYLRKSRGIHDKYHLGHGSVPELEIYDLVLFAKQIAAGMVFLGSRGVSKHLTEIKLQHIWTDSISNWARLFKTPISANPQLNMLICD